MIDFSASDLADLLALNQLRAGSESGAAALARRTELEARFESRFGAGHRLAVYGSLAPGEPNHHHLASLEGDWVAGLAVRGELLKTGWAVDMGYLALRWSTSGPTVPAQLFISHELPGHWPRLDEFEGHEYRRILAPLFEDGLVVAVANLYEASAP